MRVGIISQDRKWRVFQWFAGTPKIYSCSQLLEWLSLCATFFFLMECTPLGSWDSPTPKGRFPADGRRGSVDCNDGACAPLDTGVAKTSTDLTSHGTDRVPSVILSSLSNTSKIQIADIASNTSRVSTEVPADMAASSSALETRDNVPPLGNLQTKPCQPLKPGLVPVSMLDQLGFKPVESPCVVGESFSFFECFVCPPSEYTAGQTHGRSPSELASEDAAASPTKSGGVANDPTLAKPTLQSRPMKPELAPAAALDQLGFEPMEPLFLAKLSSDSLNCITPSCDGSNSLTPWPDSPATSSQDIHFNDNNLDPDGMFERTLFTVGRPSDAIMDMIQEGLEHINEYLTDLAACTGQPPQQIIDHFLKQYAQLIPTNNWNHYSKYFTHFLEWELERLWKSGGFSGTIESTPCKCTLNKWYTIIL